MKTLINIVLTICCTAAIIGCNNPANPEHPSGSSAISSKASEIMDPGMLISRAEAAEILGEPVKAGENSEKKAVGMKLCMYNTENPASGKFLQVSLTRDSFMPPQGTGAETIYRQIKNAFASEKTDLPELGQEAFISTGGLYLFSEGCYIQLAAGNTSREETVAILKLAGKKALENLQDNMRN